jgi:hypothetical protein
MVSHIATTHRNANRKVQDEEIFVEITTMEPLVLTTRSGGNGAQPSSNPPATRMVPIQAAAGNLRFCSIHSLAW